MDWITWKCGEMQGPRVWKDHRDCKKKRSVDKPTVHSDVHLVDDLITYVSFLINYLCNSA